MKVVDELVASIRKDLLRARRSVEAVEKTLVHLRREVGPAIVIDSDRTNTDQPVALTTANGDAASAAWMTAEGVAQAWELPLRTPGGDRCGRLLVAPREASSPGLSVLIVLASELAVTRARLLAVEHLEAALSRQQALVKHASDALMRDAGQVVRALSELERRDAATQAELHHALRFQRAMLGRPPEDPRFGCDTLYLPADVISGDLYDVALVAPDRLRIFLADATGHGVAAGLATMFIKSEYEGQKRTARQPAEVLAAMNDLFVTTYGNLDLLCTAVCIDVDLADAMIRYSTAAHPSCLLAKATGTVAIETGGTFIGVMSGVEYPSFEVPLAPGDVLFAHTDGLTDAVGEDGSTFGDARVVEALRDAWQEGEKGSVSATFLRRLAAFVGVGNKLVDDVAAVALRFNAA